MALWRMLVVLRRTGGPCSVFNITSGTDGAVTRVGSNNAAHVLTTWGPIRHTPLTMKLKGGFVHCAVSIKLQGNTSVIQEHAIKSTVLHDGSTENRKNWLFFARLAVGNLVSLFVPVGDYHSANIYRVIIHLNVVCIEGHTLCGVDHLVIHLFVDSLFT